jgi:hypothetical protein
LDTGYPIAARNIQHPGITGLAALVFLFASAVIGRQDALAGAFDDAAREIMNNSDFGDKTLQFEDYKFERNGWKVSECETAIDDVPASWSYGPIRYSCRITRLTHLPSDQTIRKFGALACRTGKTEDQARFKASADALSMLFSMEIASAEELGVGNRELFKKDREKERCVRVDGGAPSEDPTTEAAAPPQAPPPDEPPSSQPQEHPDSARFTFHNRDRHTLSVKFFSQDRSHRWPGYDEHFSLSKDNTYNLACQEGEKICYGVWRENQNVSWGVGRNDNRGCTQCCLTCGGEMERTFADAGRDAGPPPATFIIHNKDRYRLGLQFFSKTRRGHVWPSPGQQYNLSGDGTYELTCKRGEKICFGAWRDYQDLYWGVGRGENGCNNCCITCGYTFETSLNDGGPDSYARNGGGGTTAVNDMISILGAAAGIAATIRNQNSAPVPQYRPPARRSSRPSSDISGTGSH